MTLEQVLEVSNSGVDRFYPWLGYSFWGIAILGVSIILLGILLMRRKNINAEAITASSGTVYLGIFILGLLIPVYIIIAGALTPKYKEEVLTEYIQPYLKTLEVKHTELDDYIIEPLDKDTSVVTYTIDGNKDSFTVKNSNIIPIREGSSYFTYVFLPSDIPNFLEKGNVEHKLYTVKTVK